MDYKKWEPIYEKIAKDFKFSVEHDEAAADLIDKLLQKKKNLFLVSELGELLGNREIIVFGAGPSLETSISKYKEKFPDKIKITADGATTALLKNSILPDIVVTDLDGKVTDQLKARR